MSIKKLKAMYLIELLFYLTWPALIILSYRSIVFTLKRFEKRWTQAE